jgi:steroid 5-alpha reductase family enzyme
MSMMKYGSLSAALIFAMKIVVFAVGSILPKHRLCDAIWSMPCELVVAAHLVFFMRSCRKPGYSLEGGAL